MKDDCVKKTWWDVSLEIKFYSTICLVTLVRLFFHMLSLSVLACIRSLWSIGIACL